MIASAPLEHYRRTVETVLADPNVDMVMVIYLPFLGLKDIDVPASLCESALIILKSPSSASS